MCDIKQIIIAKKSIIVFSPDVTKSGDIFRMVEMVAPLICGVKIHIDIIDDFSPDFILRLKELSMRENFFIIADRKFADIGNTVNHQLHDGIYKISSWADMITVHAIMGNGTIEGLISGTESLKYVPKILLVAQPSSKNNLADQQYIENVLELARKYKDHIVGFICQKFISAEFLHFSPGIRLGGGDDNVGQAYSHPVKVLEQGTDILIIGRGIYQAKDPISATREYRDLSWNLVEQEYL